MKLQDWATRRDLGPIRYAELHDFYMVDIPLAGAIWQEDAGPVLHILDENLTAPGVVPMTTEDFESGDFSQFPWEHSGNAIWTVTSQEQNTGLFCAESGSISHNDSTTLEVTLQCVSGNITFYRKVSCEPNFDQLTFFIDGVQQDAWSGEMEWAEVSFAVIEGARTFSWTYSKDNSASRGNDTACIDDIDFPIGTGPVTAASTIRKAEQPPCQIDIHYEFDK